MSNDMSKIGNPKEAFLRTLSQLIVQTRLHEMASVQLRALTYDDDDSDDDTVDDAYWNIMRAHDCIETALSCLEEAMEHVNNA